MRIVAGNSNVVNELNCRHELQSLCGLGALARVSFSGVEA